jgi:hypothetical protein
MSPIFRQLWKKWTVDKPAAFGDLLWEVFVVQFAAWLDGLTPRRVIALIPLVILILAYAHRIPIPPELMLVGDVLAYIDIFSVILLLSILGRVTAVWFFARQAAEHAVRLASRVLVCVQRFNFRRQREGDVGTRKRLTGRTKSDDEYPAFERVAGVYRVFERGGYRLA